LLTDLVMPGMTGREVAQVVTQMHPGTHVVYMSGYTGSVIDHHGMIEEGVTFVQKPFSADDLSRALRSLLDK
jgi:DNA-binding NtrC family response regulator